MLRERVLAGVKLYQAGKIKKLLMTGDNSRSDYDEVTAMKRFAISHGVAAKDIVGDFAEFRTVDSCYRARHIFMVTDAVLVIQAYHLPRALFLSHSAGLSAVGFEADASVSTGSRIFSAGRNRCSAMRGLIAESDRPTPSLSPHGLTERWAWGYTLYGRAGYCSRKLSLLIR